MRTLLAGTKALAIPEGNVVKITSADELIWEKPASFTNMLPLATDADRKTIFNGIGYVVGKRLSSSGSLATSSGMCASGFIPCKEGDVVRIKGTKPKAGTTSYLITYDSSNTKIAHKGFGQNSDGTDWTSITSSGAHDSYENGVLTITLSSTKYGTGFDAFRFSAGTIDENTIVTVNEEIPV